MEVAKEVEKRFIGIEIRDVDEAGRVLTTYYNDGNGFLQAVGLSFLLFSQKKLTLPTFLSLHLRWI
jgi:hypothetical protein